MHRQAQFDAAKPQVNDSLVFRMLVPNTLLVLLLQANVIGSGKRLTSTVNACGICSGELKDFSHLGEEVRCGVVKVF
jgi:hypothetical protein